jgi:hypothetical protein
LVNDFQIQTVFTLVILFIFNFVVFLNMNSEIATIVDNMMGGNNELRQQAELGIKKARAESAQQFLEQIIAYVSEAAD